MPWHITYWHGSTRVRTTTIEESSETEITALLERLAIQQLDLDASESSEQASGAEQETFKVRTNRTGSMFWTTGKGFHYTAEWYVRGSRKGTRKTD